MCLLDISWFTRTAIRAVKFCSLVNSEMPQLNLAIYTRTYYVCALPTNVTDVSTLRSKNGALRHGDQRMHTSMLEMAFF